MFLPKIPYACSDIYSLSLITYMCTLKQQLFCIRMCLRSDASECTDLERGGGAVVVVTPGKIKFLKFTVICLGPSPPRKNLNIPPPEQFSGYPHE